MAMGLTSCNTDNLEAQIASNELLSAGTSIDVSGDASKDNTIAISANCNWTVETDASWITITKPGDKKGYGSQNLVFDIEASTLPTSQTATLTLTSNGGLRRTITVNQRAGQINRTVLPTSLYFTFEGGERTLEITSNAAWEAKVSGTWLHVSGGASVTGEGNQTLTVTAEPNPNPDGLEASIIVTDIDNKVAPQEIKVNIGGKAPMLEVTPANNVVATGGTTFFNVKSNFSWHASITTDGTTVTTEQWALFRNSSTSTSGVASSDGVDVYIDIAPNPSLNQRQVTIKVQTQADMGEILEKTLVIKQDAASLPKCYTPHRTNVGMTEIELAFRAESSPFPITEGGVLYSTDEEHILQGTSISGILTGDEYVVTLKNLDSGTTYHAVAYVKSAVTESTEPQYSFPITFTTRLTPGRDGNPTP